MSSSGADAEVGNGVAVTMTTMESAAMSGRREQLMAGRDISLRLLIKTKDEASKVVGRIWAGVRCGARAAESSAKRVGRAFLNWKTRFRDLLTTLCLLKAAADAVGDTQPDM